MLDLIYTLTRTMCMHGRTRIYCAVHAWTQRCIMLHKNTFIFSLQSNNYPCYPCSPWWGGGGKPALACCMTGIIPGKSKYLVCASTSMILLGWCNIRVGHPSYHWCKMSKKKKKIKKKKKTFGLMFDVL